MAVETKVKSKLNTKKIELTNHAYQRVVERIGEKNKQEALTYCKNILGQSEEIGEVVAADGNTSILYAHRNIAIYLSPDKKRVLTVNKFERFLYEPLKKKVAEMAKREIRKLTRQERTERKKLKMMKLEYAVKIASLKLRKEKTRSKNVKLECDQEIITYENEIKEYEKTVKNIQEAKRQATKSLVSIL